VGSLGPLSTALGLLDEAALGAWPLTGVKETVEHEPLFWAW